MQNLLYEVDDVELILNDPNYILVDCRFDLSNEHWGYSDYLKGHIPGAFYADLNKNLSSPPTVNSGRHPLPAQDEFIAFLSELGINKNRTVLLYDTTFGSFAVRLWWLLHSYGHLKTFLINGGFQAWVEKHLPVTNVIHVPTPREFRAELNSEIIINWKEMLVSLGD
ncbi:MAG: sulfurtransferase, partial [Anaerolineaceae bacterium]|nr:sulfurtransferase [Anaerolineaceae bacterium]